MLLEVNSMLAILAVLCPPVAVSLVGKPAQAVTSVGLTMLFFIPGMFYAVAVVQRHYVEQRNQTLMGISSRYAL
jgi:uncharacterized membrane protein YqaE (UPF0057 family)